MMRVLKIIFALTMAVFVAACTGSGTSGRATILAEVEKAEPNSIYVYRDTGFAGSGALMEVLINNQKAGTIGINCPALPFAGSTLQQFQNDRRQRVRF